MGLTCGTATDIVPHIEGDMASTLLANESISRAFAANEAADTATLATTGASAENTSLEPDGLYHIRSDIDFHAIFEESTGSTAATTSHRLFGADTDYHIRLRPTHGRIATIKRTGQANGTVWLTRLRVR